MYSLWPGNECDLVLQPHRPTLSPDQTKPGLTQSEDGHRGHFILFLDLKPSMFHQSGITTLPIIPVGLRSAQHLGFV